MWSLINTQFTFANFTLTRNSRIWPMLNCISYYKLTKEKVKVCSKNLNYLKSGHYSTREAHRVTGSIITLLSPHYSLLVWYFPSSCHSRKIPTSNEYVSLFSWLAPLEIVFHEQRYSSHHSGWSLAGITFAPILPISVTLLPISAPLS